MRYTLVIEFLCIISIGNGQILFKNTEILPRTPTTRLFLKSKQPLIQDNKVDAIQDFIVDKLSLPHLRWKVTQARAIGSEEILFEMANVDAADLILNEAKRLLDQNKFKIESAEDLDFYHSGFSVRRNFD